MSCGRRFGKSISAAHEALYALLIPDSVGWIVSPSYELSEKIFRVCYWSLMTHWPEFIVKASNTQGNMEIRTKINSVLKAKSADNPDSLIGEGLNFLIIDEASRIKDTIWDGALRPALADKQGWMIAISTPKGHNWFYNLFVRGQDPQHSEFQSFTFPSSANPYLNADEIENARQTTPQNLFRQEWLAEFLDDSGGVFRGVREAIVNVPMVFSGFGNYVTGVDLAKYEDFTVLTIIDKTTRQVVHFERFNQLDWNIQLTKIIDLVNRFPNNTLIVDSTGVGDGIYDVLQSALRQYKHCRLFGIHITNSNKKEMIDNLALAIERKDIKYPAIPELVNELSIFTYTITASRNVTYHAPSGYHDDCVLSLSLAYAGLSQITSIGLSAFGFNRRKD